MSQQNKTFGQTLAEQGDDEDDRVEPSEDWKRQQLKDIEDAQRKGTMRSYDLNPRSVGPLDDFDFEPRRSKKGSSTVPSFCAGGKVIKTWSK
jgi:hypothetical protein